jgi:hypothetical protein
MSAMRLPRLARRHPRGRLVEEQDLRLQSQGDAELELLLDRRGERKPDSSRAWSRRPTARRIASVSS